MSRQEEEILDRLKINILDEKRTLLCGNLNPKDHYPYLRSKFILSEDDEEVIEVQQTRKQKVHKFLDILVKKGKAGFDELVRSIIQERTQLFLAQKLNEALEEKQKRLHALMRQNDNPVIYNLDQSFTPQANKMDKSSVSIMDSAKLAGPPITLNRNSFPVENPSDRNSISDLGVDTENLPKPKMVKTKIVNEEKLKDEDFCDSCESSIQDDKSIKVDPRNSLIKDSKA